MNPYTGAVYGSIPDAFDAGENPEHLIELTGSPKALKRATKAIRSDVERRAKRKAQKASRKRNRG